MTGERIANLVAHLDDVGEGAVVLELLRHEASGDGVRIVDLLYRGDVVVALNKKLSMSVEKGVISQLVKDDPGVIKIRMGRKHAHTVYSVPESAARRIHTRLMMGC